MKLGNIVENKEGLRGVIIFDIMNCCTEEETPVNYDGTNTFLGTNTNELKVIGPENPIPDHKKCGTGKGEDCCIFLTVGADGFSCERHGSLRNTLIFKTMNAKRNPIEPYPKCMNQ